MWQTDTDTRSLEMGNAFSISGCEGLQILSTLTMPCFHFSLRRDIDGAGSVVKTRHLLEFFWHWILIIPSGNIFLEQKGQNHFSIFFTSPTPPAQHLNFFPIIALPVSKRRACSYAMVDICWLPISLSANSLSSSPLVKSAWFLLGDAGEETKV